jgi:hypothetical protein
LPVARGTRTKLTPAAHRALVKAIGAGVPYKFAAAAANCSEASVYSWLSRARKPDADPILVKLLEDIKAAEAQAVEMRLKQITAAGEKQWQAHAWVLERRFPDQFGAERREIKELKKQIAELMERVGKLALPVPKEPDRGVS